MSSLTAIVLAAGHGTRMRSETPKVLHSLAGRPLIYYPLVAAFAAGAERALVVSSGDPAIEQAIARDFSRDRVSVVTQDPPRGTGDAARIALRELGSDSSRVLLLYGDTPLVRPSDLGRLIAALDAAESPELAVMTCLVAEPKGYGRALRDADGRFVEIREERDLTGAADRAVREVNAGMYAARTPALRTALGGLTSNNAQGEFYLTDAVRLLGSGRSVAVLGHPDALVGVNDRAQLHAAEELMFARIRERLGVSGVTVRGDARIDDTVEVAPDSLIEAGVRLRGRTRIGRGALIDVGVVLDDVDVGHDVVIRPYSVMRSTVVRASAQIGPFSHLRPGAEIGEAAHIGNFVEVKNVIVHRGAKANHLAYLGDGEVGENANIGAGTIFCNYDGFVKHRTVIGAGAFIGSDSQLIAPITIGKGAYVATGTTVTEDVPEDALAIGRTRQQTKPGYAPRLRARLAAQKKK
jgi:bifunctional UDP-N-acetylglucosamine pyrophosphorylase / glucosamine-1-phosphate N-acetyltransferase